MPKTATLVSRPGRVTVTSSLSASMAYATNRACRDALFTPGALNSGVDNALWTLFTVPEPDGPPPYPRGRTPGGGGSPGDGGHRFGGNEKSRSLTGTGFFITDLRQLDREPICGAKEN
ncbi:hypothetical protein [Streptomyces sp. NBC_00645]|uniref:hypothetical protein n=1 Tax=Streptomyces sp. NBC_00645 TaxID=2975795 RepID=UPI003254362A